MQLSAIYEKSGASGQFLSTSPSLTKIKYQARSKSLASNKMKSLKLPSLTMRSYIPSGRADHYENSKLTSNQELRSL